MVPANVVVRDAIASTASNSEEILPVVSWSHVAIGMRAVDEKEVVDDGGNEDIVSAIEAAADNDDIEMGDASRDDVDGEEGGRAKTLRGGGGGVETDASAASGEEVGDGRDGDI